MPLLPLFRRGPISSAAAKPHSGTLLGQQAKRTGTSCRPDASTGKPLANVSQTLLPRSWREVRLSLTGMTQFPKSSTHILLQPKFLVGESSAAVFLMKVRV